MYSKHLQRNNVTQINQDIETFFEMREEKTGEMFLPDYIKVQFENRQVQEEIQEQEGI